MSEDMVPVGALRKAEAERDAFKDLAERAVVMTALGRFGPLCAGRTMQVEVGTSSYEFRMVTRDGGVLGAELVPDTEPAPKKGKGLAALFPTGGAR